MDEIGHHVTRDRSVRLDHLRTDVNERDPLPVIKRLDLFVDGGNLAPASIGRFFSTRKDSHENDVRVWAAFLVFRDEQFDTVGDLRGAVLAAVVGANHENDNFWINPINLAVVETPQDVLHMVAFNAEIGGDSRITLVPHFFAGRLPAVHDRIALKNNVEMFSAEARHFALHVFGSIGAEGGNGGGVGDDGSDWLSVGFNCEDGNYRTDQRRANAEKKDLFHNIKILRLIR